MDAAPQGPCLGCGLPLEHALHPANVSGREGFLCCKCEARAQRKLLELIDEMRGATKRLRSAIDGVERAID